MTGLENKSRKFGHINLSFAIITYFGAGIYFSSYNSMVLRTGRCILILPVKKNCVG